MYNTGMKNIIKAILTSILVYILFTCFFTLYTDGTLFEWIYKTQAMSDANVIQSLDNIKNYFPEDFILHVSIFLGFCSLAFSYYDPRAKVRSFFMGLLKVVLTCIIIIGLTTNLVNLIPLHQSVVYNIKQYELNQKSDKLPEIEVDADEIYNNDVQEIETVLATMPSFLLNRCEKVYIMDSTNYLQAGSQLSMDDLDTTAAFSYSQNMSIYIRIITDINVGNTYEQTIAHELSHIYDFSMRTSYFEPYGCSDSEEFVALYEADPNAISEYGSQDVHEFFAEAGSYYIIAPEKLQGMSTQVYNYFDQLYGPNMDS